MTKRKRKITILLLLIAVTLCFIFGNSLQNQEQSSKQSTAVAEAVKPIYQAITAKSDNGEPIIRKIAHFIEFSILGIELTLLFCAVFDEKERKNHLGRIVCPLFCGLLAALTDETLQILSERGPMVSDVWLDFIAVCVSVSIVTAVKYFRKKA